MIALVWKVSQVFLLFGTLISVLYIKENYSYNGLYSIITYSYFRCHSRIVTVLMCESQTVRVWSWILFLMYSCMYKAQKQAAAQFSVPILECWCRCWYHASVQWISLCMVIDISLSIICTNEHTFVTTSFFKLWCVCAGTSKHAYMQPIKKGACNSKSAKFYYETLHHKLSQLMIQEWLLHESNFT